MVKGAAAKVRRTWDKWATTILLIAVFLLAAFTHVVDVRHNNDTCNAVQQVHNAVRPLTDPIEIHSTTDPSTVLRVKVANEARAKAKAILDRGLSCR